MKYIDQYPKEALNGKRILVRAGLDVPLNADGSVNDTFRVKRASETIRYLSEVGAKVIVISHIGRDPHTRNNAVAKALSGFVRVTYVPDILGHTAQGALSLMREGDIVLLENLRTDPREEAHDAGFAASLATLCDLYVDDAFSVMHRAHASVVGIPLFVEHCAGLLVKEEVARLDHARMPEGPSLVILGGAKFETKAPLIDHLLKTYDHLFLTGALANDVLKARGYPVGASTISAQVPSHEVLDNPRLIIPSDVTVLRSDGQTQVKPPEAVLPDERIVDIGPDSLALLAPYIAEAKSILWNGPTGIYEQGFIHWTQAIAELVEKASAQAVMGGGDTVAAIEECGVAINDNTFLSTGGGAMLDYLLDGTLPGIEALRE